MTALTPQQMREMAMDAVMAAENADRRDQTGHAIRYRKMAAALRSAANQLEALDIVSRNRSAVPYETVRAILTSEAIVLTADAAPQEPRMSATDAVQSWAEDALETGSADTRDAAHDVLAIIAKEND